MSTNEILTLLETERDRLNKAIEVLRGSANSHNGTEVSHTPTVTQTWTSAKRKAASERMRRYWAAKRRKKSASKA